MGDTILLVNQTPYENGKIGHSLLLLMIIPLDLQEQEVPKKINEELEIIKLFVEMSDTTAQKRCALTIRNKYISCVYYLLNI